MSWAAVAQTAPKTAAEQAPGTGGARAAAPSSTAAASSTPPATAGAGPTAPVVPPVAPPDTTAPAAPEAQALPPEPPASDADLEPEETQAERAAAERLEARRKRRLRRQRLLEAEEEREDRELAREEREPGGEATETAAERPRHDAWRLIGPHFLLGVERVTSVLAWNTTRTVEVTTQTSNGFPTTSSIELAESGTDVSFLGAGGTSVNVFALPRVALDGMLASGLTLGGSLSYVVSSGEEDFIIANGGKVKIEDPTRSVFVLAPRIGFMFQASSIVGVWLRGGVSRISASTESRPIASSTTGQQSEQIVKSTATLVDLTFDPQLVIAPLPHVGFTLGGVLDIGVGGSIESTNGTTTQTRDIKQSSYGLTAGLVAIL
jgi:hypothetical protein